MRLLFTALLCAAALLALPAAAEDYYAPRDWSKDSKGKMNISAYLFRDMNRNGIYDLPFDSSAGNARTKGRYPSFKGSADRLGLYYCKKVITLSIK